MMKTAFPTMARAKVVSNNDPQKLGRVRVRYPWMTQDSATKPSEWASIASPYASKDSGMWFLPEKDDEVLVYFENGNPDYPIVLGNFYSGSRKPSSAGRPGDYNENNQNDLKFIKTRAGHLVCFDDSDDKRGLVIRDGDGRKLEIESKEKRVTLADAEGNRVVIESSEIRIEKGGTKITLKDGEISIEAGQSVSVSAQKVDLKASAVNLGEGAASALIKGDLFQTLFNAHTHSTSMGPSGPPMTPMTPAMLSTKTKTG